MKVGWPRLASASSIPKSAVPRFAGSKRDTQEPLMWASPRPPLATDCRAGGQSSYDVGYSPMRIPA